MTIKNLPYVPSDAVIYFIGAVVPVLILVLVGIWTGTKEEECDKSACPSGHEGIWHEQHGCLCVVRPKEKP
jgi:hypothetical protein